MKRNGLVRFDPLSHFHVGYLRSNNVLDPDVFDGLYKYNRRLDVILEDGRNVLHVLVDHPDVGNAIIITRRHMRELTPLSMIMNPVTSDFPERRLSAGMFASYSYRSVQWRPVFVEMKRRWLDSNRHSRIAAGMLCDRTSRNSITRTLPADLVGVMMDMLVESSPVPPQPPPPPPSATREGGLFGNAPQGLFGG